MRYLLLLAIAYFLIKAVGKMLTNLKIVDKDAANVNVQNGDSGNRLKVDESDIEDADFKEVE